MQPQQSLCVLHTMDIEAAASPTDARPNCGRGQGLGLLLATVRLVWMRQPIPADRRRVRDNKIENIMWFPDADEIEVFSPKLQLYAGVLVKRYDSRSGRRGGMKHTVE